MKFESLAQLIILTLSRKEKLLKIKMSESKTLVVRYVPFLTALAQNPNLGVSMKPSVTRIGDEITFKIRLSYKGETVEHAKMVTRPSEADKEEVQGDLAKILLYFLKERSLATDPNFEEFCETFIKEYPRSVLNEKPELRSQWESKHMATFEQVARDTVEVVKAI